MTYFYLKQLGSNDLFGLKQVSGNDIFLPEAARQ